MMIQTYHKEKAIAGLCFETEESAGPTARSRDDPLPHVP